MRFVGRWESRTTSHVPCSPRTSSPLRGIHPNEASTAGLESLSNDLTDVIVDTGSQTVSWTGHVLIKGETAPREYKEIFRIVTHHKAGMRILFDDVTRKLLEPPKEVPTHTFILSNADTLYYLFIPEESRHAILLEPNESETASWINIRFGRCRKGRP